MQRPTQSNTNFNKGKNTRPDFNNSFLMVGIGAVLLTVLILNKKLALSIPIFGKELDFFGINWKVYVQRNWIWFIFSILMLVAGAVNMIVILITLRNKKL